MADNSITERFGAEHQHCPDCGAQHPEHTKYCPDEGHTRGRSILCRALNDVERLERELAKARESAARARAEAQVFLDRETHCRHQLGEAVKRAERAEKQAAHSYTETVVAQRDARLRGFAIVRAAFEAWRDGDKGLPADDPDVFLALQATHLGFQALDRALKKK